MFTAVLDQRIIAMVCSAEFISRKGQPARDRAELKSTSREVHPNSNDENGDSQPRFDVAEVLAAIAPRAVFIYGPSQDEHYDVEAVKQAAASASAVYELCGVPQGLRVVHWDSENGFTQQMHDDATQWLDGHLKRPRRFSRPTVRRDRNLPGGGD